ncbi:MAG TPA: D-glycerate dehydrogenase [Gemmatimonadaceae bacterium]|nr:D-glycerate dehydrogenase [Gemmatimonadaceae bacterium]
MEAPTVLVSRRLPDSVEARLKGSFDAHLNASDAPMSEPQLIAAVRSADAIVCTVGDRLPEAVLAARPRRVRILANFGVGYDHIDVDAARRHGVVVTNTPDVLTDDTADLAIALMLMTARRLGEGERELRAGAWTGWRPTHMMGSRLTGKTLGIIGMGRIGRAVARRARAGFAMRVVYHNTSDVPERQREGAEPRSSVDAVLAESDFVSLHVPGSPATRRLIGAGQLRSMKRGAFLINTARGGIVDEAALAEALRERTIAGAGLDVYEAEPAVHTELTSFDNVVLLPHLGSATHESRIAMGERVIDNLVAFFAGEDPPDRVA